MTDDVLSRIRWHLAHLEPAETGRPVNRLLAQAAGEIEGLQDRLEELKDWIDGWERIDSSRP